MPGPRPCDVAIYATGGLNPALPRNRSTHNDCPPYLEARFVVPNAHSDLPDDGIRCSADSRCTAARVTLLPRPIRANRSRSSVGERPPHTRKVAGSIPAGTTVFVADRGVLGPAGHQINWSCPPSRPCGTESAAWWSPAVSQPYRSCRPHRASLPGYSLKVDEAPPPATRSN